MQFKLGGGGGVAVEGWKGEDIFSTFTRALMTLLHTPPPSPPRHFTANGHFYCAVTYCSCCVAFRNDDDDDDDDGRTMCMSIRPSVWRLNCWRRQLRHDAS